MNTAYEPSRPGGFWICFLWALELTGIAIGAGSSFSVTFGGHLPDHFLDWFVAAPLVALSTIELMRIYLARAFCYHSNLVLRLVVAAGLVLCTGVAFENWTIGIERLVNWRFNTIEGRRGDVRTIEQKLTEQQVANAEREVKRKNDVVGAQGTIEQNNSRLTQIGKQQAVDAEAHDKLMQTIRDGCLKIAERCLVPKQEAAQKSFEAGKGELTKEATTLSEENARLQAKLREAGTQGFDGGQVAVQQLQAELERAKSALAHEANDNVLNRLIGSVYGVAPEGLSDPQFQRGRMVFSMFSALALSISITIGALAYYWPRRNRESKASRAWRAYLARRRKPVVRTMIETVEKIVDKIVEVPLKVIEQPILRTRTIVKYMPFLAAGVPPADTVIEGFTKDKKSAETTVDAIPNLQLVKAEQQ
jgi:hypothetical protein